MLPAAAAGRHGTGGGRANVSPATPPATATVARSFGGRAKRLGQPPERPAGRAQRGAAPTATGGSQYQQEVDVLRSRIDTLTAAGVWTDANPPKFAGIYGRVLQALEAGTALRDSFGRLNDAAATNRDTALTILKLVRAHTTPRFDTRKGG